MAAYQPSGSDRDRNRIQSCDPHGIKRFGNIHSKLQKVVLMLGPCGECGRPKDDVLRAILEMRPHLITHLVAESRVIRAVLN